MHQIYTTRPIETRGKTKLPLVVFFSFSSVALFLGLLFPTTLSAQIENPLACVEIQSVSWQHTSACEAVDGSISLVLTNSSDNGSYRIELKFGHKDKTIAGLSPKDGVLTAKGLYPGDYSDIVVIRESDGCRSAAYERTIVIDHGCDLSSARGVCGNSNFNYTNCEGENITINQNNLTPNTYIYTDNDYLACGIAFVDGCSVQPSVRAYCLDYNKQEPTPAAGFPYGTGRFTRVVGALNAGYTNELAMERINWLLCNAPSGTTTQKQSLNQAIWYFTNTIGTSNSLVTQAISAVPAVVGGIASQMIFYLPEVSTVQPFIEDACFTICRPDLTINNNGDCTLEVFWNNNGTEVSYGAITSGNSLTVSTYENHVWNIRALDGTLVATYTISGCGPQTVNASYNNCHDACNGNVLTNPGFESGLTGWTTAGTNVATTTTALDVYTGTQALLLDDANSSVTQTFTIASLQSYELIFWAKEQGSAGTYSATIEFLSALNVVLGSQSVNISGDTYQEYSLTGLAPLGTLSGRLRLRRNNSTNGNAYFDEVCLTLNQVATPTESPGNWNFSCESDESVELIATAPNCQSTTVIGIPNSGSITEYVVEIVYKGSNPGSIVTFTDAAGDVYSMDQSTPIGSSTDVKVYRGLVDGSTTSITYTDLLANCSLQSIVIYAFRSSGGSGTSSSGTFTAISGYHSTETITLPIPTDFTSRNITVSVPVSEVTGDCRLLHITAEAGGVSATVTISEPDASYGACCLAIPEITLNNVPPSASQVTITVVSPTGSNNSCPPTANQNGQSYVIAGFVQVEAECGDCNDFSAGSISGEEEQCGPYDPSVITGTDLANGSGSCPANGSILLERYLTITGTSISNLTSDPDYPGNPDYTTTLTSLFEAPTNILDNYGQRLTAYLCPPTTGNYTFWIASDDASELNLSTDDNPANATTIASVAAWTNSREWTKFSSQQSSPVYLEAGQVYYIEAIMKEGTGGDNLAVGWQLPGGTLERPIPAAYFSSPSSAILVDYQWQYRVGTSGTWTDIPGATGVDYDPDPITQTTQYRREVSTTFCGSLYSGEVTKRVVAIPSVTVGFQDAGCTGAEGAITFTFADVPLQTEIAFSLDGGLTYLLPVPDNSGSVTYSNLPAGVYNLYARWGMGECPTFLQTVELLITPGPSVIVTDPQEVCANAPLTLTATPSGGTPPYTYLWSTGATAASIDLTPAVTANYSVTVTDAEQCEATDQTTVTVKTAAITQLVIYNLDNNTVFDVIQNGDTYIIADLPANYNIEAVVTGDVESVRFMLSGAATDTHIENDAPYRYKGDAVPLTLATGAYALKAETFSQNDAAGLSCANLTVNFTILPCTIVADAGPDQDLCDCEQLSEGSGSGSNPIASAAGNFNAFIGGNATFEGGDADGPVAIGGDLTLNGNFIFAGQTAGTLTDSGDSQPAALVVDGKVNYTSGGQFYINSNGYVKIGDLTGSSVFDKDLNNAMVNTRVTSSSGGYNSTPHIQVQTMQPAGSVNRSGLIGFSSTMGQFGVLSSTLAGLDETVTNAASISLTSGTTNVLNITGSELASLSQITYNDQPSASTPLIINVDASGSFNWNVTNTAGIGPSQGKYIIWNFYNTSNLTLSGSSTVTGTILAPGAALTKNNSGNVDGQVVAASYVHKRGEIHNQPFSAELQTPNDLECADLGRAVTLTASGGESFLWSTGATTASISVSPVSTTTYTVTVTTGNCSDTDEVTVTVNPSPTANAGPDQEICDGGSATLVASGGGTYQWSTGDNTQSINVSPAATTTYYVTVTNANNCEDIDEVTVFVFNPPTVTLSENQTICSGETVQLSVSAAGGTPAYNYLWSTGATTASISVTPLTTTVYNLTVTDSKGCQATGSVTITLDAAYCNSIGSTVFADLNNNGIQDSGEPGISGVTVEVYRAGDTPGVDTPIGTDLTNANGSYYVGGLPNGNYVVYIPTAPGTAPISSTNTDVADNEEDGDDNGIQAGSGNPVVSPVIHLERGTEPTNEPGAGGTQDDAADTNGDMTVDFGFYGLAALGDYVWEDLDGDGIQDSNEPGVGSVTVNLKNNAGVVINTTTTASDGSYSFPNLQPGTYSVQFGTP